MQKALIVGDLHGDWGSLNALISNKKPDIVLCTGDFGWWPRMEITKPILYGQQKKWKLKGIKRGHSKVYFCDGNHEEHPLLLQDGQIHEMYDGIYHASRSSTLTLEDGRVVLFAGGAESIDRLHRVEGHDWFPEELISNSDYDHLVSHREVDIVISHTCPISFLKTFPSKGLSFAKRNDPSCHALQGVLEYYHPKEWYFGHWHKHMEGRAHGCKWVGLNYPKNGGKWWHWL